jgi:hypothetical protein
VATTGVAASSRPTKPVQSGRRISAVPSRSKTVTTTPVVEGGVGGEVVGEPLEVDGRVDHADDVALWVGDGESRS